MTTEDITKAAFEASPPVVYATLHLFGVSLPDWVAILTMMYILLQGAHLIWKWRQAARQRSGASD